MTGNVDDGDQGQSPRLGDCDPADGDIVPVRCRGHQHLHLVKALQGDRFLIGNPRRHQTVGPGRRTVCGIAASIGNSFRCLIASRDPAPAHR